MISNGGLRLHSALNLLRLSALVLLLQLVKEVLLLLPLQSFCPLLCFESADAAGLVLCKILPLLLLGFLGVGGGLRLD